jgi:hypothetical protein
VQLADELEAKQNMVKVNWECWKEANKQREALDLQINGPSLFEWDDLSEEALRDTDRRLRWSAYEQTETEIAMSSHFVKSNEERTTNPSPHYHQIGSQHVIESDNGGNKGGQGGKRQGQLLVKTWEVVTTSLRMRAAQRRRKATMKATKARLKLRFV